MKAPDKIYVDDLAVVNDCSTKISTKPLSNFSEYIRKDALMEWAKERYNSTISNVGCYTGHSVWAEVIEKLESL